MKRIVLSLAIWPIILQVAFASTDIVVAISATPSNMSPFFSTDASSQNINRLVHRSLVDANSKMQYICYACDNYQIAMKGEKEIISFRLKSDLAFHDGAKVEASDVKKSWEYFAKNEKIKSTFMGTFETIESVNIKDKYNVEMVFKHFAPENLSDLALLKIVKINNPNKDSLELKEVIGCGDYQIVKSDILEVVLRPNDHKKPNLIFKVVKDETTLALKLINKEIDLSVATMSPRKIAWLKKQKNIVTIWEIPSANYIFMGLNHKKEYFKDLRVKQAISYLIPREEILKYKLQNTAVLSRGMFSPAFIDMYEPGSIDQYNPQLAEKLLSEAGYGKHGKKLELDWKISNNKASIEVAEVIQHYLEKAGIKINLSVQEWGTYMSSYKSGKFDLVVAQWVGFTGPQMLNFVYNSENIPPKGGNRVSYKNPEVDNYLNLATKETNNQKRIDLYKKAQEVIRKDYASINLWHPNIIWIGSPCLKNVELDPTGSFESLPKVVKNCDR